MRQSTVIAAVALSVIGLSGVLLSVNAMTPADKPAALSWGEVLHDDQRQVTCWTMTHASSTLSCLPDWMITAPRPPLATSPDGTPCTTTVCEAFARRREAQACAMGELTGPACDAWRERSARARAALGLDAAQ